jgi:hypothetical protein
MSFWRNPWLSWQAPQSVLATGAWTNFFDAYSCFAA